MTATLISDVSYNVQTFWSPMFMDEVKESTILAALVNKEYQGELKKGGDTVRVSQVNRPTASRKTIGSGHDSFETTKLSTSYVDIKADQVITGAYEFDSLVDLQSQIGDQSSKIRQGLVEAFEIELNNYLYSLVSPSTSAPDHLLAGVSDFNATAILNVRKLASQAKWPKAGGWWLLLDPSFMNDLLSTSTLTSSDYADDMPSIGGQMAKQRFGFNILEDNSAGMKYVSPTEATSDLSVAFHPDFMHLVMQKEPTFEVSSLHSNKQHGYIISVHAVVGAKLGISGNVKHVTTYNA